MHRIEQIEDVEGLKYAVASDPKVIRNLAMFAHVLGFAWCGGTKSGARIGEDFDVRKSRDGYIIQANYRAEDHPSGPKAHVRLKIELSNFRIVFDPSSFKYGKPVINDLNPISAGSFSVQNPSSTITDHMTKSYEYTFEEAITHTTSVSFTEGASISVECGFEVPFVGEASVTTEFSFESTQSWGSDETSLEGSTFTDTWEGDVPPKTRRTVTLYAFRTSSDVKYSANALIDFDFSLSGYLRYSGNARSDHPTGRPYVTLNFGGNGNGLKDAADKWKYNSYMQDDKYWDWKWMEKNYPKAFEIAMKFIGGGIGMNTSGKFNNVKGIKVDAVPGELEPLVEQRAMVVAMDPTEAARKATIAAAIAELRAASGEKQRAASGLNEDIDDEELLLTDGIPGIRLIKIG